MVGTVDSYLDEPIANQLVNFESVDPAIVVIVTNVSEMVLTNSQISLM